MGKVNLKGSKNMDELAITPGGLRPKSKVHLIEKGFHVSLRDGILRKVDSSSNDMGKALGEINSSKPELHVNRNILRNTLRDLMPVAEAIQISPITDRWIVYAGWMNDSSEPISYFKTKWVVPPPPATDNGQLIYLFNGIENNAFDVILQPVLQWGNSPAGGGSYWAIANWFVGSPASGVACHSNLIPVNPGDVLGGIMILENRSGNKFSYLSSFEGVPDCDLRISDIGELVWANETLECYGVKQFIDYPDATFTAMTDIEIRLGTNQAHIIWEAHNDVTDNGQHCSIITNASPGGEVSIFYRQQLT